MVGKKCTVKHNRHCCCVYSVSKEIVALGVIICSLLHSFVAITQVRSKHSRDCFKIFHGLRKFLKVLEFEISWKVMSSER